MIFVGPVVLTLVFLNYALILRWLPKKKRDLLIILALCSFVFFMFYPYYVGSGDSLPRGHDQVGRFFETFVTSRGLENMEDTVWSNLWYCGYSVNHFYPPAAKYESAFYVLLLESLGYPAIESTMLAMRLQTVLAFLFSGLAFYLLSRTLQRSIGATVVGTVAFLSVTWHIQSISISRFAEFYLLPLLLVSYLKSLHGSSVLPTGVIAASLLLTHQHSFLAGIVFLSFFALAKAIKTRAFMPFKMFALATICGLGLTTFWSLPYILEVNRTWGYLYRDFPSNTALSQSLRILESYVSRPSAPTELSWYYPTYLGLSTAFLALLSVRSQDTNKLPWWTALLGVTILTLPVAYLTPCLGGLLARLVRAGSTGLLGDQYPDQFGSYQIRLVTGAVMAMCYLASVGFDHLYEIVARMARRMLRGPMPRLRTAFISFTVGVVLLDFSSGILLISTHQPRIHEELNMWLKDSGGVYRTWTYIDGGSCQSQASMATIYTGKPFISGWQIQSANRQLVEFYDAITDMLGQKLPQVPELLGVLNVRYLIVYPESMNLRECLLRYPEFNLTKSFSNGTLLVYENSKFLPIIRSVIPAYSQPQRYPLNTLEFARTIYYNHNVSFVASAKYSVVGTASYETLANVTASPLADLHVTLLGDGMAATFRTSDPVYLAISLSDSPDWTGSLDGHSVELFSMEPGMMGVRVPTAGTHFLELRYSAENLLHLTADVLTVVIGIVLLAAFRGSLFPKLRRSRGYLQNFQDSYRQQRDKHWHAQDLGSHHGKKG
nr:hypothetical protein [Candidatus Njordarchaeum guaymaensis]